MKEKNKALIRKQAKKIDIVSYGQWEHNTIICLITPMSGRRKQFVSRTTR